MKRFENDEKEDVNFVATAIRGKENEKELDSLFFTLCDNGLIEQCPNDEIPKSQKLKADGTLIANFESKKCASCPLKEKCVAYKSEKQSRIKIDTKRRWLDERNAKFKSGEYQTLCKLRPPVEGLMETKTKISEGAN
ncbi:MAG: transposase [Leptospiraceae bacterium]|nr:transposase [Leptospiraceae bacterium]MCK6382708.1 transposase [Leptospiraceae bacterium]NUM42637.1 transposase [Leptospiraceae bacterium]